MKKLFCFLFGVTVCTLITTSTIAQTAVVSEKKFDELVNEVRQLRIEVQRLSASAQQMQLLLDRLRTQQEQVTRLTQQLSETRDQLSQTRLDPSRLSAMIEQFEKQKAVGMKSDEELKSFTAEKEDRKQREQILMQRELQLSSELETERTTLNDLKTRLDKLEQEIAAPSSEPTKKQD